MRLDWFPVILCPSSAGDPVRRHFQGPAPKNDPRLPAVLISDTEDLLLQPSGPPPRQTCSAHEPTVKRARTRAPTQFCSSAAYLSYLFPEVLLSPSYAVTEVRLFILCSQKLCPCPPSAPVNGQEQSLFSRRAGFRVRRVLKGTCFTAINVSAACVSFCCSVQKVFTVFSQFLLKKDLLSSLTKTLPLYAQKVKTSVMKTHNTK